jgi:hypothetical protein
VSAKSNCLAAQELNGIPVDGSTARVASVLVEYKLVALVSLDDQTILMLPPFAKIAEGVIWLRAGFEPTGRGKSGDQASPSKYL